MSHADASLRATRVDLRGLMRVLGENLYSTPQVAIRELVQNAHDSIERRRLEAADDFAPDIRVSADPAARTLTIEDTGAGLTREEVEQYLATVGAGYTRLLRDRSGDDQLIGYFGLGFLSAFVVSDKTEVWTCSYKEPDSAWLFSSRSGDSYVLEAAPPREVGTRVTLRLSARFSELSNEAVVRRLLERYCCLLQHPVSCNSGPPVNAEPPPWRTGSTGARASRAALELAARFDDSFDPLCTIPVGSDGDVVRGILWLHDAGTYGTTDNRSVSVFVRGMLIGDDERELLPRWAGFAGAVLESKELVPTASRESLMKDAAYERSKEVVRRALSEGLAAIAVHDRPTWRRILLRHNEALLGAAIADPSLFDVLAEEVTVPTSEGDRTMPAVVRASGSRVCVSQGEGGGFEELLFRALKVPVVRGHRYGALSFAREYCRRRGVQLALPGTGSGDSQLFRPATLSDTELEVLRETLVPEDATLVPSHFAPEYLPFVLVPDREAELKRTIEADEADKRIGSAVLSLARLHTAQIPERPARKLYVNLDSPVIRGLLVASSAVRDRVTPLLRPLVALLTREDRYGDGADIERALSEYGDAVRRLLEES